MIGKRHGREVAGDGCHRTQTLPRTKLDNFGRPLSIRFNCKADVVAIRITKIDPAIASPMFRARSVALSEAQFWG